MQIKETTTPISGPNLDKIISIMSDNKLDCCTSVDRVYQSLHGHSVLGSLGVDNALDLIHLIKNNTLYEAVDKKLTEQGFVRSNPAVGQISFVGKSVAFCVGDNLYVIKSKSGAMFKKIDKEVRSWKCPN